MGNLKTREKIIIVIMALAILYGFVVFLMPTKKNLPPTGVQNTVELETLVATLSSLTGKGGEKEINKQIAKIKQGTWQSDPFIDEKSYSQWLKAKEPAVPVKEQPAVVFVYSGYLGAGKKRLAVINGFEYREGDVLEMKGSQTNSEVYKLKSVSPEMAVIMNTKTGITTTLPLEEFGTNNVNNSERIKSVIRNE